MSYVANLLIDDEEISWYDDFYIERYTTVTAENLVEMMHEVKEASDSSINEIKEQILQQNLGSFEYDW